MIGSLAHSDGLLLPKRLLQGLLTFHSPSSSVYSRIFDPRCISKYTVRILLREPRNYLATKTWTRKHHQHCRQPSHSRSPQRPPSPFQAAKCQTRRARQRVHIHVMILRSIGRIKNNAGQGVSWHNSQASSFHINLSAPQGVGKERKKKTKNTYLGTQDAPLSILPVSTGFRLTLGIPSSGVTQASEILAFAI